MSNTFLTVNEIAKESLMRLQNNLVLGGLVHKDFSNEFSNKGDIVTVRKPATFIAKDFTTATDPQGVNEGSVPVSLDKIADVTVEVTSKQLGLNIQDFGTQIVDGAMQAIAQKIDSDIAELYVDIPYFSGTAGNTPAALADIANAGKVLNDNKVPFGNRRFVMDPEAQAKLVILDSIAGADKSGSTAALRDANMGRILGFDTYLDQNIKTHTSGTETSFTVAGTAGELELSVSAATENKTFEPGDIIYITDSDVKFIVSAKATVVAALTATVKVTKPVIATFTGKTGKLLGSHVANLAFHKNAFSLVNRPQALPLGGAEGYIANYNGLSIRVTMGYTMSSKINTVSFDILYGVKTLDERLAVRVLG